MLFPVSCVSQKPLAIQKHYLLHTHPKTHAKTFSERSEKFATLQVLMGNNNVARAKYLQRALWISRRALYIRYSAHYHPVVSHCFSHAALWSSAPATAGAVSPSSCALGSPSGVAPSGASSSFRAAPSPSVVSPSCGAAAGASSSCGGADASSSCAAAAGAALGAV